jgi:hypothetical protein
MGESRRGRGGSRADEEDRGRDSGGGRARRQKTGASDGGGCEEELT